MKFKRAIKIGIARKERSTNEEIPEAVAGLVATAATYSKVQVLPEVDL